MFNDPGKTVEIEGLATDARRAYVDVRKGKVVRVVLLDGSRLSVAGKEVVAMAQRGNYER